MTKSYTGLITPSIEDRILQVKSSLTLALCAMSARATAGLRDGERDDAAIDAANEALQHVRALLALPVDVLSQAAPERRAR